MENQYTYDAFISYRHIDLDMFVAENLHKYMESFKLPKNIIKTKALSRTKIERVFRDQEELPLTNNLEDPIMQALYNSEYLVVICSPRLKESLWCKKEIETFIQYHGRENIFAVLVEGEPQDSFPEELLYADEWYYDEKGNQQVRRKSLEPLAADMRGSSKKEILKKIKLEGMRLLAPMFGVHFDDLRQRHRERKMRKVFAASIAISLLGIIIGAASTVAALRINKQKKQIEEQSIEIQAQADEIVAQAEEIQAQYDQLLVNQAETLARDSMDLLNEGDRMGAISLATQALTEYEDIAMPYTPEAQLALTESLGVYDNGIVFKPVNKIDTYGVAHYVKVSPKGRYAAIADGSGSINIWDTVTYEHKGVISGYAYTGNQEDICFIDEDTLAAFIDGDIVIYQISTGKPVKMISMLKVVEGISVSDDGAYMAVSCNSQLFVYSTTDYSQVHSISASSRYFVGDKCYFTDDGKMIYTEEFYYQDDEEPLACKLSVFDLTTGEQTASLTIQKDYVNTVAIKDGICYATASSSGGLSSDLETIIIAIDINNGKVIWENNLGMVYPYSIELARLPEQQYMMVCSYTKVYIIEYITGNIICDYESNDTIISGMYFDYMTAFFFVTQKGEIFLADPELKTFHDISYLVDYKDNLIQDFDESQGGYIIVPAEDDKVNMYGQITNPDREALVDENDIANLDLENVDWQEDLLLVDEYVAMAEELGLEKAALVTTLVYSEDESVVFVTYADNTIEVIDTYDLTVLETVEDAEGATVSYLGTDSDGNHYVSGADYVIGTFGYCFNSDYQLIAIIDNLIDIDSENGKYIIGEADMGFYSIPMYSVDELIEMAKETLK